MAPSAPGANSRIASRVSFLLTQFQIRPDDFALERRNGHVGAASTRNFPELSQFF